MNFADWKDSVIGRTIGDGQCFALWQDYATRVVGAPASLSSMMNTNHPGYAIGVWDGYAVNGAQSYFTKVSPLQPARKGDVAFWKWGYPFTPLSHVAIVDYDAGTGLGLVSQNSPTPVTRSQVIPKIGLAGYFRPIDGATTDPATGDAQTPPNTAQPVGIIEQAVGIVKVLAWIQQPENWKRVGIFMLGAILISLVIVKLITKTPMADTVITAITE